MHFLLSLRRTSKLLTRVVEQFPAGSIRFNAAGTERWMNFSPLSFSFSFSFFLQRISLFSAARHTAGAHFFFFFPFFIGGCGSGHNFRGGAQSSPSPFPVSACAHFRWFLACAFVSASVVGRELQRQQRQRQAAASYLICAR